MIPPPVFLAVAGGLGLCIGSFLNVVIARLPRGESLARPGSHCACGAPIRWRDNLPLVSWFVLGGHARCCGRPISARYPLVEAATAACFILCWQRYPPAVAVCGWVFLSALLAAACIDAEHMILPESLTLGLGVAGMLLLFAVPALHAADPAPFALASLRSGASAVVGLFVGTGLVMWVASVAAALLKRDAMGMGDVLFVGAVGAFCGWRGAVFCLFGGAFIGLIWVLAAVLARRPAHFTSRLPFGPMLALAAALYFLFLRAPVDAWFGRFTGLFSS